jgi:hypothetical protein
LKKYIGQDKLSGVSEDQAGMGEETARKYQGSACIKRKSFKLLRKQ